MSADAEGKKSIFSGQKIWAVLLVADSFFVILFGGALAATLYEHWQAPQFSSAPAVRKLKTTSARMTPPVPRQAAPQAKAAVAPEPKVAAPQLTTAAKTTPAPQAKGKAVAVVFKLKAPHARSVQLVGGFLVRAGGKTSLRHKSKGVWTLTLYLMPGSYRYYFLVNGKKKLDPSNYKRKNGGSWLTVPAS